MRGERGVRQRTLDPNQRGHVLKSTGTRTRPTCRAMTCTALLVALAAIPPASRLNLGPVGDPQPRTRCLPATTCTDAPPPLLRTLRCGGVPPHAVHSAPRAPIGAPSTANGKPSRQESSTSTAAGPATGSRQSPSGTTCSTTLAMSQRAAAQGAFMVVQGTGELPALERGCVRRKGNDLLFLRHPQCNIATPNCQCISPRWASDK